MRIDHEASVVPPHRRARRASPAWPCRGYQAPVPAAPFSDRPRTVLRHCRSRYRFQCV